MPVIYGIHPVHEALDGGDVERLVVQKDNKNPRILKLAGIAKSLSIDVRFEQRHRLDRLTDRANHQGIVAYVAGRSLLSMEEILDSGPPNPLYLVLDGIEDPHNLGAIIRSAEASGVSGVFIPKRRNAPLSDTVWKVSAGAVQHVPIARVSNVNQTINTLKKSGVWVIGADIQASKNWYEVDFTEPSAIVVGREGEGLHKLVRKNCDFLVRLPMKGRVQSLNVAVSAGILLYEAVRQRKVNVRE